MLNIVAALWLTPAHAGPVVPTFDWPEGSARVSMELQVPDGGALLFVAHLESAQIETGWTVTTVAVADGITVQAQFDWR